MQHRNPRQDVTVLPTTVELLRTQQEWSINKTMDKKFLFSFLPGLSLVVMPWRQSVTETVPVWIPWEKRDTGVRGGVRYPEVKPNDTELNNRPKQGWLLAAHHISHVS